MAYIIMGKAILPTETLTDALQKQGRPKQTVVSDAFWLQ